MTFNLRARCHLAAPLVTAASSISRAPCGWSYLGLLIGSVVRQAAGRVLLMSCRLVSCRRIADLPPVFVSRYWSRWVRDALMSSPLSLPSSVAGDDYCVLLL
jgi:hypothetical protein